MIMIDMARFMIRSLLYKWNRLQRNAIRFRGFEKPTANWQNHYDDQVIFDSHDNFDFGIFDRSSNRYFIYVL